MPKERRIRPVTDNIDKQRTYADQMGRYKRAISGEFYFEAMLIDYAMLEDRLRSMIYHMGFLVDRSKISIWRKTRFYLVEMVSQYKREDESDTLGIKNISGKIKIVRSVLLWASEVTEGYQNDKYLTALKQKCEDLDIGGILETLDNIESWCIYRNEVIHALLNKNMDSLQEELKEQTILGMEMARYLDSQEKILKSENKIRKSVNLTTK